MELRIQLLGSIALHAGDRHSSPGTPKDQLTLAALAWDVGRPVGVDTLVHRLWDEPLPRKPREALYVHIRHLRTAFAAATGGSGEQVVSGGRKYLLRAAPDEVDLRRYLVLLERAQQLADGGSLQTALQTLEQAQRLWTGEPMAGLPGTWAAEIREQVAEKRRTAVGLHGRTALYLGQYDHAAAVLKPLVGHDPGATRPVRDLALALHGAGRSEEAATLLQQTNHRLQRSGLPPDDELNRIHRGILNRVPVTGLLPALPAALAQGPAPGPVDTLPPAVAWVGRRTEVERLLAAATGSGGLVPPTAITGMAGSGKTTLAAHAARRLRDRFPDGQILVNLRGQDAHQQPLTPESALRELLRQLGTPLTALPRNLDELTTRWRAAAGKRRFVAVLDDAAGADQVRPLLPGAATAALLITSRHQLTGLPGVQQLPLDVLTPAEAEAFLRRALGPERTADPQQTATLARQCGHLPLALDITASRLLSHPSWGLSDMIEQYGGPGRLSEIRDPSRAMEQVFDVSYRALTLPQQRAFCLLGLHLGAEFGIGAAAALIGLPRDETEEILDALLAWHLCTEPAPHRYRFHDLLREYALKRAETRWSDQARQAVVRLLDHYLAAADHHDRRAYPQRFRIDLELPADAAEPRQQDSQAWFTREGTNLRAVLDYARTHGSADRLARTAHVLAGFLTSEGNLGTATAVLAQAVDHWDDPAHPHQSGRVLIDLGTVLNEAGSYDAALAACRRALDISLGAGDTELAVEARHQMSICYWHMTQLTEARELQQQALDRRVATQDRFHQARSYNIMGMICLDLERYGEALNYLLQAQARFCECDDRRGRFVAAHNLAELYKRCGDVENAIMSYRRAMDLAESLGDRSKQAVILTNLADAFRESGDPRESLELYEEALPLLRNIGDRRNEAIARNGMGIALCAVGRIGEALANHRMSLAIARDLRVALEEVRALRGLADTEMAAGKLTQARTHLEAALRRGRDLEGRSEEAATLQALARLQRAEAAYQGS